MDQKYENPITTIWVSEASGEKEMGARYDMEAREEG